VLRGTIRSMNGPFLILALTMLALSTTPTLTGVHALAIMSAPQMIATAAASNTTSTTVTSTGTSTNATSTAGTTTSSSDQWDIVIPVLLMGFGAGLAVVLAVVVFARRRKRTMPTVQIICSRCRAPVGRRDTVCRNCGATLYHQYQFYPRRR